MLVPTEQADHLPLLQEAVGHVVEHGFILRERLPKKQRAAVFAGLGALDGARPRVLLTTGCLIGEGFDHPPLDTLILAIPYILTGSNTQEVRIYDYAETDHPQLARMWSIRRRSYRAMGYEIKAMEDRRVRK